MKHHYEADHQAFDSSGRVATEDFTEPETDEAQRDLDGAIAAFEKLLNFVWQNGPKNDNGIQIRAVLCCWIFLKHLRPMSLTEMAAFIGRDKQSLGRWFDAFKKDFPEIKTTHMKNK